MVELQCKFACSLAPSSALHSYVVVPTKDMRNSSLPRLLPACRKLKFALVRHAAGGAAGAAFQAEDDTKV